MVDLTNAVAVPPNDVTGVITAQDGNRVDFARVSTPTALNGLKAENLSPYAEAGVQLVRIILQIVVGSIVILFLYLTFADYHHASDTSRIIDKVITQSERIAGPGRDRLEAFIKRLEATGKPADPVVEEERQAHLSVIRELAMSVAIDAGQEKTLITCLQAPPDEPGRAEWSKACTGMIEPLRLIIRSETFNIERTRQLAVFAKEANEYRQNFRSFWMQIAQLILLNLLLPLLTALLGYIFGTQQTQRRSES